MADPAGAFRDFAVYTNTMPDPAMVLVQGKAAGLTTVDNAQPSGMRRVWVTAAPPADYPVSGGGYAWRRGAFASVGVRVNAMTANSGQFIDGAQFEATPLSQSGPSAYAPARSLQVKVNPDRLNYCPNPALAVDLGDYWSSATITRVAQGSGWAASVPGTAVSLCVAAALSPVGQLWSASVVVKGPVGKVLDVRLHDGVQYISPAKPVRMTGSPQTVQIPSATRTVGTAVRVYAYPRSDNGAWTATDTLTMTNVLLERKSAGGVLPGPYFDGGFGDDYLWEAGGTAGKSRSYYYRDRNARGYLLAGLLAENCPLGVIPSVPQYAVLPTD